MYCFINICIHFYVQSAEENWSSGNCTLKQITFDSVGHLKYQQLNNVQLSETVFADYKDGCIQLWNRWTLEQEEVIPFASMPFFIGLNF